MEFQTEWNYKSEPSNPGDDFLPQFIETIDKNGKTILKKTGDRNIKEEIQEAAKGTDIYAIIDKYLATGDETLLNMRKGFFGDFTKIPNNPVDIHNMIVQAENVFNQLDKDIRAEFENDAGVFKQSILDETFIDRIAPYIGEKTKAEKAAELTAQIENQKSEVKKGE